MYTNNFYQDLTTTIDSMVACLFTSFALNPDLYAQLVGSVMGFEMIFEVILRVCKCYCNIKFITFEELHGGI